MSTVSTIGAKPNLYCEAIELVCGGSPKICVLVEWKALDRVKSEQMAAETSLDQLFVQYMCTVMDEMEAFCNSHKSLYRDLSLYEDHEIRRAAAGEPTLLE